MDILLIQPYFEDFYCTAIRHQPIGLMSIMACLQREGYSVGIFDFLNTRRKKTQKWPEEFRHLAKHYRAEDFSPASIYRQYYRFGHRDEELYEMLERDQPLLIGISALFTGYLSSVIALARYIKTWNPRVPIMVGGHAVAADYQAMAARYSDCLDYLIYGEGEAATTGLAGYCVRQTGRLEDIPNLCIPGQKGIHITPVHAEQNLDDLPWPNRDHLDYHIYHIGTQPMASLSVSRGCPYHCTFCSVHDLWGFGWRHRSVSNIIEEIKFLYDHRKIRIFNFEDDNLTYQPQWFENLLDTIIEKFPAKDIRLLAMNGLNFHTIPQTLAPKLKQAGFHSLNFSISTASFVRSLNWNRPATIMDLTPILDQLRQQQITITIYFIIGSPDQTPQEVLETIIYLSRIPVYLGPSLYYLTPGQPLARQNHVIFPENCNLYRSTACYPDLPSFSSLDKITLLRLCRYINYLKELSRSRDYRVSPHIFHWLSLFLEKGELRGMTRQGKNVNLLFNRDLILSYLYHMKDNFLSDPNGTQFRLSSVLDQFVPTGCESETP